MTGCRKSLPFQYHPTKVIITKSKTLEIIQKPKWKLIHFIIKFMVFRTRENTKHWYYYYNKKVTTLYPRSDKKIDAQRYHSTILWYFCPWEVHLWMLPIHDSWMSDLSYQWRACDQKKIWKSGVYLAHKFLQDFLLLELIASREAHRLLSLIKLYNKRELSQLKSILKFKTMSFKCM